MRSPESFRTRLIRQSAKVLWIITTLLFALSFWLFYQYSNNQTDAGNAAGFFGILTIIIAFIFMMMAIVFSVITKGSRRLDAALRTPESPSTSTRKTVESEYQVR